MQGAPVLQAVAPFTPNKKHILDMADNVLITLCLAHRNFQARALPSNWQQYNLVLEIIEPLTSDVIETVRIAQQAGVTIHMGIIQHGKDYEGPRHFTAASNTCRTTYTYYLHYSNNVCK